MPTPWTCPAPPPKTPSARCEDDTTVGPLWLLRRAGRARPHAENGPYTMHHLINF
jgi:hypothetical protein